MKQISDELYKELEEIGIIDDSGVHDNNVGESNYHKYLIQPWHIWKNYSLNPWDADIIKRVLRTKVIKGKSWKEARKEDYEKIIHICNEMIRQLNVPNEDLEIKGDSSPTTHSLNKNEEEAFEKFRQYHYDKCKGNCSIIMSHNSGIGIKITTICEKCKEEEDITDYNVW